MVHSSSFSSRPSIQLIDHKVHLQKTQYLTLSLSLNMAKLFKNIIIDKSEESID